VDTIRRLCRSESASYCGLLLRTGSAASLRRKARDWTAGKKAYSTSVLWKYFKQNLSVSPKCFAAVFQEFISYIRPSGRTRPRLIMRVKSQGSYETRDLAAHSVAASERATLVNGDDELWRA